MNAQSNGSALDPREIHIPSQEPMVAAMASPRSTSDVPDAVDENRTEQLAASSPNLPQYLAEKYFWKRSAGGKFYLSPIPAFIAYVQVKALAAAEFGYGLVYPGGERDKTDEASLVADAVEHSRELLHTLTAMNEKDGEAFKRFLVDRATRNAVYAATTQFELENWAARSHARGQDANSHPSYTEKESRLEGFARQAGVGYAIARDVLGTEAPDADGFSRAAKRVIYESASFEGDKLLTPVQLTEQQKASAQATVALARRF
jgi:hypothetical protein